MTTNKRRMELLKNTRDPRRKKDFDKTNLPENIATAPSKYN